MSAALPVTVVEPSEIAVAGFLARYREPTLSAYRRDVLCFLAVVRRGPAATAGRPPAAPGAVPAGPASAWLRPRDGHRRLSTVAGMLKYTVIDELVATNPTMAVTRPRVRWEGQRRTVLHPLEFTAVLSAARRHSPTAHALVAMLGMLGLRVSEACNARVQDLRYAGGYELLRVLGTGAKPAEIPLPSPVLRAVKAATDGHTYGPILLSAKRRRADPGGREAGCGTGSPKRRA